MTTNRGMVMDLACRRVPEHASILPPPEIASLLFSLLCIATASLVLAITNPSEIRSRTLCVGGLTIAAFLGHVLARRAYRDPFHPDILLTTGHLVQFVLFSTILASGLLDQFLLPRARDVRTHFPEMIFAVLVAQTCFNVPFCLLPSRRCRTITRESGGVSTFIACLALLIWGARCIIVATGSYLHTGSSDFKFESTAFSPLAIFDTVGRIVTAYVALRLFLGGKGARRGLYLAYLLAEVMWTLFSGAREPLFMVFVCVLAAFILVRCVIPWKTILVLACVIVLMGAYLAFYRDAISNQGSRENISIERAAQAALEKQTNVPVGYILCAIFDRINDGQFAAGCIKYADKRGIDLDGKTYTYLAWVPIPRFVIPSRPQFIVNYCSLFQPWITWSSGPVTTVGEAYLNFRWPGIVVVFLVLGIVYRGMDRVFDRPLSTTEAAILLFYSTLVLRMTVNPVVSHISWMTKVLLLLLIAICMRKARLDWVRIVRSPKREPKAGLVLS